jgi:hypothetical protein
MSLYLRSLTLVLAGLAGLAGPLSALAQATQAPPATSPSQSSAQSEAGEPRAATSADGGAAPSPPAAGARASGAAAARVPAAGASAGGGPAGGGPVSGAPNAGPAAAGTAHPSAHPSGTASGPGGKAAADRLELGTATVTGDREQPKVMYIVPWKRSDIGDLSGKPMNSLLDEALAPVDRDEFKRQVMYYQVVKADASQNGASKAPAAQGEK